MSSSQKKLLEMVAVSYKHCFRIIASYLIGFRGYVIVHVCGRECLAFSLSFSVRKYR